MSSKIKMARLDLFTFKSQFINFWALLVSLLLFSYMGSTLTILCITAAWFIAILVVNIFAIQEKNALERLYSSLSINLKDIVAGRYLFSYVIFAIALFLSLATGMLFSVFQQKQISGLDVISAIGVSFFVFTCIVGVQIPMFFRFGYMKAKIWSVLPVMLVMGIIMLPVFFDVFEDIVKVVSGYQIVTVVLCCLLSLVLVICSYFFSTWGYRKRR